MSRTIYLLAETIDLGYHARMAFSDRERAENALESANRAARMSKFQELMNLNYSPDQANKWMSSYYPFEIDEVELEEESTEETVTEE